MFILASDFFEDTMNTYLRIKIHEVRWEFLAQNILRTRFDGYLVFYIESLENHEKQVLNVFISDVQLFYYLLYIFSSKNVDMYF